jgi:ABC-type enterochelin transport system permease subunit
MLYFVASSICDAYYYLWKKREWKKVSLLVVGILRRARSVISPAAGSRRLLSPSILLG